MRDHNFYYLDGQAAREDRKNIVEISICMVNGAVTMFPIKKEASLHIKTGD